jgi:large subunit ribosomal protein L17
MCRNLAQSLFQFGQVRTTIPKAKEVRPFAERLITLALDGSLASRQRAISLLGDRAIIPAANQADYDRLSDAKRAKVLRSRSGRRYRAATTRPGVKFTAESVIHRLFSDIGPRMKRRNEAKGSSGGYTRIIKLADRRLGDGAQLAVLQLVGESDPKRSAISEKTARRRRAAVRYAVYAGKPRATRGRRRKSKPE